MADHPDTLISGRVLRRLTTGLAIAALAIVVEGAGPLDLWLADAMFDFRIHEFPWQRVWLMDRFSHVILKNILIGLGALPVAAVIWDAMRGGLVLPRWWQLRLRVLVLCIGLVPLTVSLLKRASHSHCPWDLERYGGYQPYYHLLEHIPYWVEAGHCLPGGHASSALWLVGLSVFWLPLNPRKAAQVAAWMLLLGGIVGWMQQIRGAHFFSHTLWSIWVAAAIMTAVLAAQRAWAAYRAAALAHPTDPLPG